MKVACRSKFENRLYTDFRSTCAHDKGQDIFSCRYITSKVDRGHSKWHFVFKPGRASTMVESLPDRVATKEPLFPHRGGHSANEFR